MFLMPILMGHGEVYWKFLAWDLFTPLARITFGAYMLHPLLIYFNTFNTPWGNWGSIQQNIISFLAFLLASYAFSLVMTILVETPSINLESKYLMGRGNSPWKSKEHALKFNSGMAIDDASTTRSDSTYSSESQDLSPLKGKIGQRESLLRNSLNSSEDEETRFSIKKTSLN